MTDRRWCRMSGVDTARFDYGRLAKEEAPCPLCGGAIFEELARADRYGMGIRTVRCLGCGFVMTNPRPVREAMEGSYRDHYPGSMTASASRSSYGAPNGAPPSRGVRRRPQSPPYTSVETPAPESSTGAAQAAHGVPPPALDQPTTSHTTDSAAPAQ